MNRILVSLCFLFSACGEVVPIDGEAVDGGNTTGDDGGAGADASVTELCAGPEIAIEDMETCFLRAQCQQVVRCLPGFPDVGFCETRLFDFFSSLQDGTGAGGGNDGDDGPSKLLFETFRKAAASGVANYDAAKAFACVESLKDASCKADGGGNPDCELILTGDTAENGACFDDFECLPGARCERDTNNPLECSIVGQCRMGAGVGGICDPGRCQPGLECVYPVGVTVGVSGTCRDGSVNSPCSSHYDCQDANYCGTDGSCVADRASGAGCTLDEQCPGDELCIDGTCASVSAVNDSCRGTCFGNLYCDEGSASCQPMPGQMATCGQVPATSLHRCDSVDLNCADAQGVTRCIPRIPVGGPCGGVSILKCALGSFCESEFGGINMPECTAPQANGSFCNVPKHCASGFCEPGTSNSCEEFVACWEE